MGQPAWPVLVLANGQHQQSGCKPHVDCGGGSGLYSGDELGTNFGSGAEAFSANWLLLHQKSSAYIALQPSVLENVEKLERLAFISWRLVKQRGLSCLSLQLLREAGEVSRSSPCTDTSFSAEGKFSVAVKHVSGSWKEETWEESEELRKWEHIRAWGLFLPPLLFLSSLSFLSLPHKNVLFHHP